MKAAISKTYLACDKPIPDNNGLKAKIAVCLEDLAEIPTEYLDQAFRLSRQRKAAFFPSVNEILQAWRDIDAENDRRAEVRKTREVLKALPEHYPSELATDSRDYIENPTPEKLKRLQQKYPNAGFK